ncbi:IS5 family transposase ISOt6 [Orientia tsutsugamushi]|nr:IS5 family transposase ISOt6 [Orientia tsutsugamushi]
MITDTGYQGIQKIHNNSELPKKKSKKNPLTKKDKKNNLRLAGERVVNENVIGMLKRFKIIADKYRNRRKRFGFRFNLISGIYNFELLNQFRKRSNAKKDLKEFEWLIINHHDKTAKELSIILGNRLQRTRINYYRKLLGYI